VDRVEYLLEAQRLVGRLLELPALIRKVGERLTALRAERRAVERELKDREARAYLAAEGRSAQEREARARVLLAQDPEYQALVKRLDQLHAAIDVATEEKNALEHERKAIYGALVDRHAQALEMALAQGLFGVRPPAPRGGN
jgi:predicted  nucleic acid-binding Zn-ribbon protein